MNSPGDITTIQEATRAMFELLRELRISRGRPAPPAWDELGIGAQMQWSSAVVLALEIGAVAMVADFMSWAKDQGDLSGGIETAMRKYAADELQIDLTQPQENDDGHPDFRTDEAEPH